MTIVIVFEVNESIALRMLNIFPALFSSVIALGTGYLLGSISHNPPAAKAEAQEEQSAAADD
jgi:hypothetical protein